MYQPNPVNTSNITVPEELLELCEDLAKNVHDVWAQQRIEQGWKLGKERNDQLKLHPNLVPYEELSELDKEYDRKTAIETIKMIISLGYEVQKISG